MKSKNWMLMGTLLLGMLIMLTACADSADSTENNKQGSLETEDGTMDTESTEHIIDSFVEQSLDLTNYSLAYEQETDDQPFFYQDNATKSGFGYYYFKGSNLMFYDIQSKTEVPLCNKADCSHGNSDCNADFGSSFIEGGYSFLTSKLQYYDGNIYLIGFNMEGYTSLFKIAADGSSREKYMELYKADMTSSENSNQTEWTAPHYFVHRGYVYYINKDESIPKIRRMKLGSTETEVVFETSGIRPNLYRMQGYGDYIFFQTGNYTDEDCIGTKGGIYAYNIHTGKIQLVKADAIATYIIANNTVYYLYNGNTEFRSFDLVTQEDKMILDKIETFALSVDEYYIYKFSNNGLLSVYDHEGNSVCTVGQAVRGCYFGDGTYIIGRDYDFENNKHLSCVIEVSDFADGKAEWTYLD